MVLTPDPAIANYPKGVERKAVLPSRLGKRLLEGIRSVELRGRVAARGLPSEMPVYDSRGFLGPRSNPLDITMLRFLPLVVMNV